MCALYVRIVNSILFHATIVANLLKIIGNSRQVVIEINVARVTLAHSHVNSASFFLPAVRQTRGDLPGRDLGLPLILLYLTLTLPSAPLFNLYEAARSKKLLRRFLPASSAVIVMILAVKLERRKVFSLVAFKRLMHLSGSCGMARRSTIVRMEYSNGSKMLIRSLRVILFHTIFSSFEKNISYQGWFYFGKLNLRCSF